MCITYLRMNEHQALYVDPKESFESVHRPEQAQPQPQVPPPATYPFI